MKRTRPVIFAVAVGALAPWIAADAQRAGVFDASRDHPSIAYATGPVENAVDDLNKQLTDGRLAFEPGAGYLRSVLQLLSVPIESQVLVFSQTSAQADRINIKNPRAVFFNDRVAVGWVRGGERLELAAHDTRQGTVFYTLDQRRDSAARFRRDDQCLACHLTWDTLGVPGPFVLTTFPMPDDKNAYAQGFVADHRSPFAQRWGGWFVTGQAPAHHLGNIPSIIPRGAPASSDRPPPKLASVEGRFDLKGYPSPHSDVAALMVLEHQTRMMNLITRAGWEARLAGAAPKGAASRAEDARLARVREAAVDLVDYLLFIDEEPLPHPVRGSSPFADRFSARGPRDAAKRSLYELDLNRRLLRYRCSYMVYSPPFAGLPPAAKQAVYERLWGVLSGKIGDAAYSRIPVTERRAIVEILRSTLRDLPPYFQPL